MLLEGERGRIILLYSAWPGAPKVPGHAEHDNAVYYRMAGRDSLRVEARHRSGEGRREILSRGLNSMQHQRSFATPYTRIMFLLVFLLVAGMLQAHAADRPADATGLSPRRIISLGPTITEKLYLLNAQDRLVGVTTYCERPPEALSKEKVGNVTQVNIEKIVELKARPRGRHVSHGAESRSGIETPGHQGNCVQ